MSLVALAARAVQMRVDAIRASNAAPEVAQHDAVRSPDTPAPPAAVSEALKRLIEHMPTETITLFWLAVPASEGLATWWFSSKPTGPTSIDWFLFAFLLLLTPALLLLIYLSGLASRKAPRPPARVWPWWKAAVSMIAFATWAFAVPGNPFVRDPLLLMVVWFGATLVSTLISLLDPIVDEWFSPKAG